MSRSVSDFNREMLLVDSHLFQDFPQEEDDGYQHEFFSNSAPTSESRSSYIVSASKNLEFQSVDRAIFKSWFTGSTVPSSTQDRDCVSSLPLIRAKEGQDLRSVAEIPARFQPVFQSFPYFNVVQSKVMDDVLHSDKSVVVCAPTGSGKTVIFELGIVHLLMNLTDMNEEFKIIYMAPIKALCSERYNDWKDKFQRFGITCFELTGDTEVDDYEQLQSANIIFTTPEKWDSTTRRWRHNRFLVNLVKLFLIDEIHMLNDPNRGATVEAVISRMMTIHSDFNKRSGMFDESSQTSIRFIAVSATIPNADDVAEWFGYGGRASTSYKLGEELRPVKLKKIVIGYPFQYNSTEFRFDLSLSYKLINIINTYSDGKPTLVFCSTRKGAIQTASILINEGKLILKPHLKQKLIKTGNCVRDNKLKDAISAGVGFHHAGLDFHDRNIVEQLFTSGELPILVATSTLAMGVNLPAHLVIIKSTFLYDSGQFVEYSDTQILQMIGRAGRPQFDTSATAVIMTKDTLKSKYEKFLNGMQTIESRYRENKHTLFSVHPYIDLHLFSTGRVMARYCVTVESMRKFGQIKGDESMSDLLHVISRCSEFSDIQLRISEKKTLNALNKDKHLPTIRFPLHGKICTREMKIHCLIQAVFGCIAIQDWALSQETTRILRIAQRLAKCLSECVEARNDFKLVVASTLLAKCFRAKLWENSQHVSRQLEKIGNALSNNLVNAGLVTFQKIEDTNPRQLELILNRHPPFGNYIRDAVALLPKYEISVEQLPKHHLKTADLTVKVILRNYAFMTEKKAPPNSYSAMLLVGDKDNYIILKQRLMHTSFSNAGQWSKYLSISRAASGAEIVLKLINLQYVGLDLSVTYTPFYIGGQNTSVKLNVTKNSINEKPASSNNGFENCDGGDSGDDIDEDNKSGGNLWKIDLSQDRRMCNHRCANKETCGHECCKVGVPLPQSSQTATTSTSKMEVSNSKTSRLSKKKSEKPTKAPSTNTLNNFFNKVQNRVEALPIMNYPTKRLRQDNCDTTEEKSKVDLSQFQYQQPSVNKRFSFRRTSKMLPANTDSVEIEDRQETTQRTEVEMNPVDELDFVLIDDSSDEEYAMQKNETVIKDEELRDDDEMDVLQHYINTNEDHLEDFCNFTVEDFQETDDNHAEQLAAELDFSNSFKIRHASDSSVGHPLTNKQNGKFLSSAFSWKSESPYRTAVQSSEKEWSTCLQQRPLPDFSKNATNSAKCDFKLASEVYNDRMKTHQDLVEAPYELSPDLQQFFDEMDDQDDFSDVIYSAKDLHQFPSTNPVSVNSSDSLFSTSQTALLHSEEELKEAVDNFTNMFGDLF